MANILVIYMYLLLISMHFYADFSTNIKKLNISYGRLAGWPECKIVSLSSHNRAEFDCVVACAKNTIGRLTQYRKIECMKLAFNITVVSHCFDSSEDLSEDKSDIRRPVDFIPPKKTSRYNLSKLFYNIVQNVSFSGTVFVQWIRFPVYSSLASCSEVLMRACV